MILVVLSCVRLLSSNDLFFSEFSKIFCMIFSFLWCVLHVLPISNSCFHRFNSITLIFKSPVRYLLLRLCQRIYSSSKSFVIVCKMYFFRWRVVSHTPSPQPGGSHLFGCPQLLIQHCCVIWNIRSLITVLVSCLLLRIYCSLYCYVYKVRSLGLLRGSPH
jgi:hypothetical protein